MFYKIVPASIYIDSELKKKIAKHIYTKPFLRFENAEGHFYFIKKPFSNAFF